MLQQILNIEDYITLFLALHDISMSAIFVYIIIQQINAHLASKIVEELSSLKKKQICTDYIEIAKFLFNVIHTDINYKHTVLIYQMKNPLA